MRHAPLSHFRESPNQQSYDYKQGKVWEKSLGEKSGKSLGHPHKKRKVWDRKVWDTQKSLKRKVWDTHIKVWDTHITAQRKQKIWQDSVCGDCVWCVWEVCLGGVSGRCVWEVCLGGVSGTAMI